MMYKEKRKVDLWDKLLIPVIRESAVNLRNIYIKKSNKNEKKNANSSS